MLCIATLFAALWSFACISARPGSVYLVDTLIGYPHNTGLLDARQSGSQDVPSQCKSTCDTPNAVIANKCTPQICCTASFETQYYNCLICVGSALNVTDYSSAQAVLNRIEQQCAANGLNIPPLILPGQGDSSPTHSTVSTSTEVTPASTTSTRDPMPTSSASSSSSILTGLHTLSVPPPPSTIVQQTVTVDTRTTAPASTSTPPVNGAAITLRAHVTCVWAIIVIMTIGYL